MPFIALLDHQDLSPRVNRAPRHVTADATAAQTRAARGTAGQRTQPLWRLPEARTNER